MELFTNKVLSLVSAELGWEVAVRKCEKHPDDPKPEYTDQQFPVVAWALVRQWFRDGDPVDSVEPVFVSNGSPVNSSEYRRIWSDPEPRQGEPKITIDITAFHRAF